MHTVRELSKKRNKNGNNEKEETCKFVGKEQKEYREKKKNTEKAACSDDHFISADRADRDRPGPSVEQQGQGSAKRRSYRSTGKCADDHTDSCCNGNAYAYPCSYSNAYASDHQRTCI